MTNFYQEKRTDDLGWGFSRGTLPIHNTMLKNVRKSWLQGLTSKVGMVFTDLQKHVQRHASQQRFIQSLHLTPKAPLTGNGNMSSTLVFVFLCGLWYTSSALSSNTGKAILTQFRYPVTLTFIQFGFVAFYCLVFMTPIISFSRLRMPTKTIVQSTLPMGLFQVVGHMFSSIAISRIPVSTVHTIKALSPLFTVAAYALLFGVSYTKKTYFSLLPLTVGVMLACSSDFSASNAAGLLCAFGSALVFVSSNIFFKKIMPSAASGSSQVTSHKLDKLNLLFYSSSTAFLLMIPLWIYYDLPLLLAARSDHVSHPLQGHAVPHSITYYFFMNGTVHFAQNIIAFIILSLTSPVTYSIASLIKRVVVICIAIVWFAKPVYPVEAFGIAMTFTGLYMYNKAKGDVEKGEKKMRRVEAARDIMLPITKVDARILSGVDAPPQESDPQPERAEASGMILASIKTRPRNTSTSIHSLHPPPQRHDNPLPIIISQDTGMFYKPTIETSTSLYNIQSPPVSYPSPPPSNDSPPYATSSLPEFQEFHSQNQGFGSTFTHQISPVAA